GESMENLGMMPRRASPRPPWRVAPAWGGSFAFWRGVHEADPFSEVWRLFPASPCPLAKPARGRGLYALAFLGRAAGLLLLQDRADAVFEGCIDEQTHCHDHQQGHDALRFFEIEGGRQKLRIFQEAKPALCLGLPFVASEHGRGG